MVNILWCGADPGFPTGYGKVNYELLSRILSVPDITVTYYCLYSVGVEEGGLERVRELEHPNLTFVNNCVIGDEGGMSKFASTVEAVSPDIIFIYNGILEILTFINSCKDIILPKTQIVAYLDVYYNYIQTTVTNIFNSTIHKCIVFSKYQENMCKNAGISVPIYVLSHGINTDIFTRIPRNIAKAEANIDFTKFLVTVSNKNQYRKRYDVLFQAWAKFCRQWFNEHLQDCYALQTKIAELSKDGPIAMDHPELSAWIVGGEFIHRMPVLMVICKVNSNEGWNLHELAYMCFVREFSVNSSRDINVNISQVEHNDIMSIINKHIVFIDTSKEVLKDAQINLVYNATDLGICTSDGEGVGLCHLEQAYLGVPQIIGNFSGLPHVLPPANSLDEVVSGCPSTGVIGLNECTRIINTNNHENAMSEIYLLNYEELAQTIDCVYNNNEYRQYGSTYLLNYYKNNPAIDWDEHAKTLTTYFGLDTLEPIIEEKLEDNI